MSQITYSLVLEGIPEDDDIAASLTSRISTQLSVHNWSLKMLSDQSGVPYETVKKVVNGKISSPSLKNVVKIASAFGCSVDYLAGISE